MSGLNLDPEFMYTTWENVPEQGLSLVLHIDTVFYRACDAAARVLESFEWERP